ncbi:MAG: tetratricopeptide repeat protein, partial [Planctomycetaceae bacterium]
SKLTKEQLAQMKAEAAAKLLEKSDALFGKPSRRLLLARIRQIGGNFELSMIQELQQIRVACLQEVVELSFSIDGKEAVGRLPLPESILSVQRSAVGDTLYWTALSQFSRGEYGTAVQTLRNHRRQYPEDRNRFSAMMNEAECLLEFGDPEGAALVLAEADVAENPELARVQWLRSRFPAAK